LGLGLEAARARVLRHGLEGQVARGHLGAVRHVLDLGHHRQQQEQRHQGQGHDQELRERLAALGKSPAGVHGAPTPWIARAMAAYGAASIRRTCQYGLNRLASSVWPSARAAGRSKKACEADTPAYTPW